MDPTVAAVLRLVHIFAGVFWAGAALTLAGFIRPAVSAAGPDGGKFMQCLMQGTSLPLAMNLSSALTALTGVALFWRISGGLHPAFLASSSGLSFTIGATAGLLAFVLGFVVSGPTSRRVAIVSKQVQVTDGPARATVLGEMKALQTRLARAGQLGSVLLAIAVTGMAVARYVG